MKNNLRLRTPIELPTGHRLRVCSDARFSTDEQRRQSNAAQHRFNRTCLESIGINDIDWEEVSDEGISGELKDRPGIRRLREGIEQRKWDLIICEDSSRLYRNVGACLELVGLAVDHGIRVICVGDGVDTAEEDWQERLQEAQQHHCRDNRYTRNRIKRSMEDLWEMGAAVSHLRSGYLRKPTTPATEHAAAKGPFYDEIDPKWAPTIHDAFERAGGGERTWSIIQWLTKSGLPKTNGRCGPWTANEFISMIQCDNYRGLELHGKTKAVKKFATGKSQQERRDPKEVKVRRMEHLRIVPDWLWEKANNAIKSRARGGVRLKGVEHPLAGLPRDTRGPLSTTFVCNICQGKMYAEGRIEGGYRCQHAKNGGCWNKATSLRAITHEKISDAVVTELLHSREHVKALVSYAASLLSDDSRWQTEEDRLATNERNLREKCRRLGLAIENPNKPLSTLVEMLAKREAEAVQAKAELEHWRFQRQRRAQIPTSHEIIKAIQCTSTRLLDFEREAGDLLERLIIEKIRAVPYRLFQTNKVVLRAEFDLNTAQILPIRLTELLTGSTDWQPHTWSPIKSIRVDLFESSAVPSNALVADELSRYMALTEIGELLGISKRQAHLAVQLGKAMRAEGLQDPYIRLEDAPRGASRWRIHPRNEFKTERCQSAVEANSGAPGDDAAA